jgi:hypothetical protein
MLSVAKHLSLIGAGGQRSLALLGMTLKNAGMALKNAGMALKNAGMALKNAGMTLRGSLFCWRFAQVG